MPAAVQLLQVAGAEAQVVGEDVRGVFAQQRGASHGDVAGRHARGPAEQADGAVFGVFELVHEAALFEVRVVEEVVGVEHGGAGDAGFAQLLHHFPLAALAGPLGDFVEQGVGVFVALPHVFEARVDGQFGALDGGAEGVPTYGR